MCSKVGGQPAFFMADTGWPAPPGALARPVAASPTAPDSGRGRTEGAVPVDERLWELCEGYLAGQGLELDDLEVAGSGRRILRITIDREGGVAVDRLAAASRGISRLLDEEDPFEGPYSLEVTSPGLERKLRRPLHYTKSIGRDVTVRTNVEVAGSRYHRGVLEAVGEEDFVLRVDGIERSIPFGQVRSAQTRFEWTKVPKSTRKSG